MKRIMVFMLSMTVLLSLVGTLTSSSNASARKVGIAPEPTIIALQTQVAELQETVTARGEKINAQRTEIAELKGEEPPISRAGATGGLSTPEAEESAEVAYLGTVRSYFHKANLSLARATDLFASSDPPGSSKEFKEFRDLVYKETNRWMSFYDDSLKLSVPEGYQELHDAYLSYLGTLNAAANTISDGFSFLDDAMIGAGIALAIGAGEELAPQVEALLQSYGA